MKDRLARIFNPKSGRTVMLAFDHGYIMGPTSGLERMDLTIVPLIEYADCLMCTRGALRQIVPPTRNKPISLRASAGSTVLTELNDECILDIEECVRLNASMLAVMVAIGSKFEALTIRNLTSIIDAGSRYGIPMLGRDGRGQGIDPRRPLPEPRLADLRRKRRARRQDLLSARASSRRSRPPARCRS